MDDFGEDLRCERCNRLLTEADAVWLELDQRTNTFHDFGGIPDGHNQGGFPFGVACAKHERKKAREATRPEQRRRWKKAVQLSKS